MRAKVLLVTGFGRFPGAPVNPTERIVAALSGGFARRLARLGWRLERRILPVQWDALPAALARLEAELAPEAVLHLGLAGRRKLATVETRAHNRRRPLSFDAAGRRPEAICIEQGAPFTQASRPNAARMVAALRGATATAISIDAGAYLCNLALWSSLHAGRGARAVAFIHVPKIRAASKPRRRGKARSSAPTAAALARMAQIACLHLARAG